MSRKGSAPSSKVTPQWVHSPPSLCAPMGYSPVPWCVALPFQYGVLAVWGSSPVQLLASSSGLRIFLVVIV